MGFDIRENVSPFFFIIKYVFNMANINKIRISGTSYDIQDSNATKVVDITQAEYDVLPASAKTANILYNITDAEAVDFSQYWTSAETQSAITEATSGKVSTSDFNTYSGSVDTALNSKASQTDLNTLSGTVTSHTASTTIHVTAQDKTNWNNKSDFSGSYNDLTDKPTIPTVPTNVSDFTNDAGYITSDDISGKTNQSDFTAHTANTTVHVSAEQIAAWNAKSDFSGSYDDLTDKPTIPTSASQLTNDTGYITSSALDGYATTATTSALNNTLTAHTADTSIHVTTAQTAAWNAKSDFSGSYNDLTDKPTIPTVPTNVSAFNNDASYATSGYVDSVVSGKADSSSLATVATSGSYNDLTNKPTIPTVPTSNTAFTNDAGYLVANDITGKTDTSAFTAHTASTVHMTTTEKTNLDSLATNIAAISGITSTKVGNWDTASTNNHTHSNKTVLDGINSTKVSNWDGAVTALGGLTLWKGTQAAYDAITNKDSNTIYFIKD